MTNLICPNCQSPLILSLKVAKCENGHSFDRAKQGYINLLLAHKKKTSEPGDSKEMIDARAKFLSSGHYSPLVDLLQMMLADVFEPEKNDRKPLHLLDVGCGSGYYTREIDFKQGISKVGLDISKVAVSRAAVVDKESTYVVGSAYDLPLASDSVDVVLSVFAPIDFTELTRVLRPNGYFLKVVPAVDHMKEIAELAYDTVIPHESSIKQQLTDSDQLQLVKEEFLQFDLTLEGDELYNMIAMTPYLYKFTNKQLQGLPSLTVTATFMVILGQQTPVNL